MWAVLLILNGPGSACVFGLSVIKSGDGGGSEERQRGW
jgi:hypothetical protein